MPVTNADIDRRLLVTIAVFFVGLLLLALCEERTQREYKARKQGTEQRKRDK